MGRPFRDALEECLVAAAGCLCWIPCGRQDDSRPPTPTGRPDRKHKHHELLHDNRPWRHVTTNHATATRAMPVWHGSSPLLSLSQDETARVRKQDKGSMGYEKIRCQHAIALHMSFRNITLPSMKILYFLSLCALSFHKYTQLVLHQQQHFSSYTQVSTTGHGISCPFSTPPHAVGMRQIPNS